MSSGGGGFGGGFGGGHRGTPHQDFELNLASIIDCFTVLIAFMLATASFLSIGIFDAGVAAAGAQQASATPPPVHVAVELRKDFSVEVKIQGKENRTWTLAATKDGSWDYPALTAQLEDIKKRWPELSATTLQAQDLVEYNHVIKTMEVTKKTLPLILLGGF